LYTFCWCIYVGKQIENKNVIYFTFAWALKSIIYVAWGMTKVEMH
jgi:hypothetical protein